MSKTDDLSAWRCFIVFAKTGSLSVAAKVLQVEPSSVSRAIAGLERALGCELIRHNARPLQMTEAGETAFKRMQTILRAHDSFIESLASEARSLSGNIRLSSAPGFASRRLTPILQRFRELHPEINIEMLTGCKEADVQKGLCEVATLTGEPSLPGLMYMSRGRNVYLPVASPDYILKHGMPLTPSSLRTHTGYIYNGPVRGETKVLHRGQRSETVSFATSIRSTDILAIRPCRSCTSTKTFCKSASFRFCPDGFYRLSSATSSQAARRGTCGACAFSLNGLRIPCSGFLPPMRLKSQQS